MTFHKVNLSALFRERVLYPCSREILNPLYGFQCLASRMPSHWVTFMSSMHSGWYWAISVIDLNSASQLQFRALFISRQRSHLLLWTLAWVLSTLCYWRSLFLYHQRRCCRRDLNQCFVRVCVRSFLEALIFTYKLTVRLDVFTHGSMMEGCLLVTRSTNRRRARSICSIKRLLLLACSSKRASPTVH